MSVQVEKRGVTLGGGIMTPYIPEGVKPLERTPIEKGKELPIPLAKVDPNTGFVVASNGAFQRVAGSIPLRLIPDKDFLERLHREPSKSISLEISSPVKENGYIEVELYEVSAKGKTYILAQAKDITDRKQREKRLIIEIAKLARENLRVRQMSELITSRFGEAVHDLRTPLTAVYGFAQLAQRILKPSDSGTISLDIAKKARHFAGVIESESKRAQVLTQEALNLSKDIRKDLTEKAIPVSAVLEQCSIGLIPKVEEKSIALNIIVSGDQNQKVPAGLRDVLGILTGNAIDAMAGNSESEEKTLILNFEISQDEAVFQIIDTGPGFSRENMNKIGSKYFTTKEEGHGHGLPMAIDKVARFGGALFITSGGLTISFTGTGKNIIDESKSQKENTRGSTVAIVLPLAK